MPPAFPPSANLVARASLLGAGALLAGGSALWIALADSSWASEEGIPIEQPVPFSHAHHVQRLGIDCRYCHAAVEDAPVAGMPSTDVCVNCHWQLWTDAAALQPVLESWREGERLRWNRVHDLPDYVAFDHSIHVAKGVACGTCHGQVDRMPLVSKQRPLTMGWCLDCHRDPATHLSEQPEVLPGLAPLLAPRAAAEPGPGPHEAGRRVVDGRVLRTRGLTDCSTCHR